MTVALSAALTAVRDLLDEPNPQFWNNAQLTRYLNEACADIARRAEWKRTTKVIPCLANTQQYDAPADLLRAYKLDFQQAGGNDIYTLEFRGYMEMDQVWGINQNWPANYPMFYTMWGAPPTMKIILYPVPSSAGSLNVHYYQTPTPMVQPTDPIDMPPGWEDITYDYAIYRALRQDSDPRWQDFKSSYEEKFTMFMDATRTWQDQAGTFTTGQQALPAWLISDGMY